MLKRGGTIGILGGGQLGRMMAMSAAQLGYHCIAYAPEGDTVAEQVCGDVFANKWDDTAALAAFASATSIEPYCVSSIRPKATRLALGSTTAIARRKPRARPAAIARSTSFCASARLIGVP